MATLALSLAGQFAGALIGGPIGATVGRALGALAGSAIDGMLFGEKPETRGSDIRLQGSSEGGAVPRLYGWSRLSGNIIWARELEVLASDGRGAKGMSQPTEDEVGASFAVAFCEGEVHRLGRIWADGQLLDTNGLTLRFYRGTETQLPDGLIEATQGVAPAYRGVCYLVVEQLPLSRFGNRIPQLSVELCRVVGDLERDIAAVTVIPGATEFGYDPSPRVRVTGPGRTAAENAHVSKTLSDWTCSIDELVALCPNLQRVALVVAWFGNDLRCGTCTIGPRVEAANRTVKGASWSVMGLGRGSVPVVSSHGGGVAYGGTPSDASVRAAIADLKRRGIAVTLYPMVMMDVPEANALPDPYGASKQAAYPWRGRITCHPAPGRSGSPDKSAAAASQVASFATRYRQMVLHYAGLAASAGGVDALVIGSEMVGLTGVRGANNSFPFVDALVTLAADVRAVVGASTKLTYAADWSEYSGYQRDGEKFFHLDPLWASANINAIGIDNYMPLADWRDGTGHADAALSANGYELAYLAGNVAGGEGYDWFYASDNDRLAQARTPIGDGIYGEPWVWRFKDIRNWWDKSHYNRPGGVRSATPTAWVPSSKPIWFTELGCAAVDKGANQPNIFGDPKSVESGRPYFSSGVPDALIQRQFLRAHQAFWRNPANNPAGMVDVSRIYHWTWDARPYPAFPAMTDVWSDGGNHRTGHWLTGRLGGMSSDELATVLSAEHGVALKAEAAAPFIGGYVLAGVTTGREALEPVLAISGGALRSAADGLRLGQARESVALTLGVEGFAEGEGATLSRRRPDPAETPGRLAMSYVDRERDYLTATVTATARADGPLAGEALALVLDGAAARLAAERMLDARNGRRETLQFDLPPSALALEPGDLVDVGGLAEGPFQIEEVRDGRTRRVSARSLPAGTALATGVDRPMVTSDAGAIAIPDVVIAHLPGLPGEAQSRMVVAGYAAPWPGALQLVHDATGANVMGLTRRGTIGVTVASLRAGPLALWDEGQVLEVLLHSGHLASAEPEAVLAGTNRLALETDTGQWEVIGFASAELVALGQYRLSGLLRGQAGTGPAMGPVAIGRRVMLIDNRAGTVPVEAHWLGEQRAFRLYAGAADLEGTPISVVTTTQVALPLPPVHLRAKREVGGAIALSWVRCSRADGDSWEAGEAPLDAVPEAYRVTIWNGAVLVRTMTSGISSTSYSAAQQIADFGALPAAFTFTIAQVSASLGAGHAASGAFHG